ncbi:MAG: hypothetical protein JWM62_2379 [Frankiales bacterium]|nr:hypothetical protein [Frankiales bacterium]
MSPALLLAAVEEEDLGTGPIGLVIILLLLIATAFLIRNMNSRLKRLPPRFPGQEDDPQDDPKD